LKGLVHRVTLSPNPTRRKGKEKKSQEKKVPKKGEKAQTCSTVSVETRNKIHHVKTKGGKWKYKRERNTRKPQGSNSGQGEKKGRKEAFGRKKERRESHKKKRDRVKPTVFR